MIMPPINNHYQEDIYGLDDEPKVVVSKFPVGDLNNIEITTPFSNPTELVAVDREILLTLISSLNSVSFSTKKEILASKVYGCQNVAELEKALRNELQLLKLQEWAEKDVERAEI